MRPLNLGETLDASIKIVRARWRTLAAVMLVVALPLQILQVLVTASTTDVYQAGSSFSTGGSSKTTYSDQGAYVAGQLVIFVLAILGNLLGTVACYRAIADTYLERPTSARASLQYAMGRLGPMLWLTLLLGLGLILGFLAFVIPAIWLAVAWSVTYPVLLVEDVRGVAALKRSFALVKDHWWATFGRVAVAYILVLVVTAVASSVIVAVPLLAVDDTSFGALLLSNLGSLIVTLLTTPFLAAVITLVYFDLRVRKEGFDLALLAERMGGAPAAGPAPAPERGHASGAGGPRDAFGNPVAASPPARPATSPEPPPSGGWAPPVAPQPQRPPSPDE
ncbi:MAG: hypothetical protein QOF26_3480 [Baekduia sp.]|nr:hypothetical protein [Baekduia sp.]